MVNHNRESTCVEILIADDSTGDIRLIREALKESKIINNLHTASDGVYAMDFLYKRNGYENAPTPDLILLDLNMPRKNGFEVLAEIKQHERFRHIPVVIMTISTDEKDVVESYNLHANCYISKPVDFTQFMSIVKNIENFWFSIVTLPVNDSKKEK